MNYRDMANAILERKDAERKAAAEEQERLVSKRISAFEHETGAFRTALVKAAAEAQADPTVIKLFGSGNTQPNIKESTGDFRTDSISRGNMYLEIIIGISDTPGKHSLKCYFHVTETGSALLRMNFYPPEYTETVEEHDPESLADGFREALAEHIATTPEFTETEQDKF